MKHGSKGNIKLTGTGLWSGNGFCFWLAGG